MFDRTSYKYILPDSLIAESAIDPHHDARLMVVDRETGHIESESTFFELDTYLREDRVIFFNNSRVLPARIILTENTYTSKEGEKKILPDGEIFYLTTLDDNSFEALVRPGNRFKIGTVFHVGKFDIEVMGLTESGRRLRIRENTEEESHDIKSLMREHGSLPLPPYIKYEKSKEKDYQTTFAKKD